MNINEITNATIVRILALITLFVGTIWIVFILHRQLTWLVISLFLAVALNPLVELVERKLTRRNRALASTIVIFGSMLVLLGLVAAFVPSLVRQTGSLISDFPGAVNDLAKSSTPFAQLMRQYKVIEYVQANSSKITQSLSGFGRPALDVARSTLGSFVAILSVISLTFFMLIEGPTWLKQLQSSRYGKHLKQYEPVTTDMYSAVTGYVAGNLLTSLAAAIATSIMLTILGVPYAIPLGIVVGLFDLLPLIGATLGSVVVIALCLFQSVSTAVIMLVFFIVYQQLENHLFQPLVYAKTVQISPLIVFVAALIGASLAGMVGALVAIPVAASAKIIISYYLESTRPTSKARK